MKQRRLPVSLCLALVAVAMARAAGLSCQEVRQLRIQQCGNATLQELADRNQDCDIAARLRVFAQWLESHDKPCSTVVKDVEMRYRYFIDTTRCPIDYSGAAFEGLPTAPVRIVVYVTMSCPLCKRLYREVTDSIHARGLAEKIAVCAKPFGDTPLEYALVAAQRWQIQGTLLRALAPVKQRIDLQTVMHVIDSLGIPRREFSSRMQDRDVAALVKASRDEALANGVTVTPTFFVNGKRCQGYKDACWIVDAAEYELRHRGRTPH